MCTLHDFVIGIKSDLFIRSLLLDRILVTEKTTRTPRVHLVSVTFAQQIVCRASDALEFVQLCGSPWFKCMMIIPLLSAYPDMF